jgi:hypothetical protein
MSYVTSEIFIYLSLYIIITALFKLANKFEYSNPKWSLSHMQIVDNSRNSTADVDI